MIEFMVDRISPHVLVDRISTRGGCSLTDQAMVDRNRSELMGK